MSVSMTGTNQGGLPTLAFAGLLGGVYARLARPLDSGTETLLVARTAASPSRRVA